MKHLQYFLDTANSAALTSKYAGFINAQAAGIVHYATGAGYNVRDEIWALKVQYFTNTSRYWQVGSVWYAPNAGEYDRTISQSKTVLTRLIHRWF